MRVLGRENIEQLPLRHIVALIARCVHRVEPIIFYEPDEDLEPVKQILDLAADFARGDSIDADQVKHGYERLPEWLSTGGELPISPLMNQVYAVNSARSAAKAVFYAASAVSTTPPNEDCCVNVVEHSTAAICYAQTAADPFRGKQLSGIEERRHREEVRQRTLIQQTIWSDYDKLRAFGGLGFRQIGEPIDPSDQGPLGALWAAEPPSWYARSGAAFVYHEEEDPEHSIQPFASALALSAERLNSLLCSFPTRIVRYFHGAKDIEGFIQLNSDDPEGETLLLKQRDPSRTQCHASQIAVLAFYPSGAARSVPADVSFRDHYLEITIDDPIYFVDCGSDQPTQNIPSFHSQVTLLAIKSE